MRGALAMTGAPRKQVPASMPANYAESRWTSAEGLPLVASR